MARKPPRPNIVAVRLTDDELAAVKSAAEFHGQSVSDWLREAVSPHMQRQVSISVNGIKVS
jgi:uncharacterized protein (DUF1778 family)